LNSIVPSRIKKIGGIQLAPVFDKNSLLGETNIRKRGLGVKKKYHIDLLNQPGPVFPVFLRTFIGFHDAGDPVVFGFFSLSLGNPAKRETVMSIAYFRHRRDQPLQSLPRT
jgi:hypothetical protein